MHEQPFPFRPLALSIATGILIANAVAWFTAETRLRYEVSQVQQEFAAQQHADREKQAEKDRQRQAALTQKYEAEFRAKAAAESRAVRDAHDNAAARVNEIARIEREEREGEYFRPATDDLTIGTYACKDRVIVKRTGTDWDATTLGDGRPARCRTNP